MKWSALKWSGMLVAAVFAPTYYLLGDRMVWYAERPVALALAVMALLLAWRHRANIQRLLQGKESRIGAKKAEPVAPAPQQHHQHPPHPHRRRH